MESLERILIIIKPDGMRFQDEILDRLDELEGVEQIKQRIYAPAPQELLERNYAEHKGKDFYEWIIRDMQKGSVYAAVYKGENVIERVKELCGPTDPKEARLKAPNSLRALSDDDMGLSRQEQRLVENIIHRSADEEAAEYEISVWFPNLQADSL